MGHTLKILWVQSSRHRDVETNTHVCRSIVEVHQHIRVNKIGNTLTNLEATRVCEQPDIWILDRRFLVTHMGWAYHRVSVTHILIDFWVRKNRVIQIGVQHVFRDARMISTWLHAVDSTIRVVEDVNPILYFLGQPFGFWVLLKLYTEGLEGLQEIHCGRHNMVATVIRIIKSVKATHITPSS